MKTLLDRRGQSGAGRRAQGESNFKKNVNARWVDVVRVLWTCNNKTHDCTGEQDDPQSVKRFNGEFIETVEQLQKVKQQLREERNLYRLRFLGRSSERHAEDDSQLHLFDVGESTEEKDVDEPDPPRASFAA